MACCYFRCSNVLAQLSKAFDKGKSDCRDPERLDCLHLVMAGCVNEAVSLPGLHCSQHDVYSELLYTNPAGNMPRGF